MIQASAVFLNPQTPTVFPATHPPTHPQVFGKDKLMSIVALMNLEGLEGSYRAMLDEAIKVGAPNRRFPSRQSLKAQILLTHRRVLAAPAPWPPLREQGGGGAGKCPGTPTVWRKQNPMLS